MEKESRLIGNIHTVAYTAQREPMVDILDESVYCCQRPAPTRQKNLWFLKLNAERCVEYVEKEGLCKEKALPYTLKGENRALEEVLSAACVSGAKPYRVDFKIDWFDVPYKNLVRINRLLLACFEVSRRAVNNYDTKSIMKKETKSLKVATQTFEIEYYNKESQAPITSQKTGIKSRLEFRNKGANLGIASGVWRLKHLVQELKGHEGKVESIQNEILLEYWKDEGWTIKKATDFFSCHKEYFYTLKQTRDFFQSVGKPNTDKFVENRQAFLRERGFPPLLTQKEFEKYVDCIAGEFDRFLCSFDSVHRKRLDDRKKKQLEKIASFSW